MDTKKYEAMVTSIQQGSFTRAADVLGYTQSGLTHMMNALETEVGFQLLRRGHFGIRLTPDGERIMPMVMEFLQASERLREEIRAINDQASETITVGSYSSIASHWLPLILDAFRKEYPNVQVNIHDESRPLLFQDVQSGRVDMAFTSAPKDENVNWYPLHDDPLLALLPKNSQVDSGEKFAVESYAGRQFLMPSDGYDTDILEVLNARGIRPEILTTSVSDPAIISMVAHGLGVSMLSELSIRGYEESVCAMPLAPSCCRHLGIIVRKNAIMKPTMVKLIECARTTVAQMYQEKEKF